MTISLGRTVAEIRELVHEYQLQPYGMKGPWLAERDVPYHRLRQWRETVFEGDLERGLVPREGVAVTVPRSERTAFERARARERAEHEAERAKWSARERELEDANAALGRSYEALGRVNEALGKAIGLLHDLREQEPDAPPTRTDSPDF